ncbi:hypothetical protein ACFV5G_09850 [Streptomyces sp. NPDC059766]|uniref:hypothetical protein n=1 Tax=Streptomyces sp. NPDC059766 TaxID=3346940 RepID=UPI003660BABE
MAVWGCFPFDGRVLDSGGTRADWDWAKAQGDRFTQAGVVVRLVVADQPYSLFDPGTDGSKSRRGNALDKFIACRNAEQLVFGRVYVAGGRLGLGSAGTLLDDPLKPGRKASGVADQIEAWFSLYPGQIDGIYLDSGPVDCTDPARPGRVAGIPDNFPSYVQVLRQSGHGVFVQVAQYPDSQPGNPWVRGLNADFLELWEAGVLPYRSQFQAWDACRPDTSPGVPDWWTREPPPRWSRVHVINDCRDIRATERPEVGAGIVADPADPEERQ